MQNWNQWQLPTGPVSANMPQPPVGYPSSGTDPMATMQAYMQYYNQPAPSGYTAEQWAAAQQQNWAQWTQWQQQYQQWQAQYGDKYQETMKQYSTSMGQPPPLPMSQPPLPKDEAAKPPLPPDPSGSYNFTSMPPPHQNNLPLFPSKASTGPSVPQNPPLPPNNPPLPADAKSGISDKSGADPESVRKMKLDEEKMIEIEKTFDAQFKQWEEQFNTWKQKNANHPDKEQYKQYEAKWTSWREKLLERREQMRKKREQQKQAAKIESEKSKKLPGGDKILNILSNTENQGLINNLLGIGKTLGLTGKQDSAASSTGVTTKSIETAAQKPSATNVPVMQTPTMTPDLNQQSWAAQQWAAQYNTGMNMGYGNYQVPPPSMVPPRTANMAMPPPNFGQQPPPNFDQHSGNYSQQPPNFMQPPPNFSQPPPNFSSDQNMFNKPPPSHMGANKIDESQNEMNRSLGPDNKDNQNDDNDGYNRNDNRFGPGNNRFGRGNDRFGPGNDRFGNDRFGPGNDRFGSGNDRFGSDNDRFGPGNDRFGPGNNRFGSDNDKFGSDNDRFGAGNDRFGNNRFNIGNDRFDNKKGRFDNKQDRFDNKQDRFGPGNNRFGPNNDRFGPSDRFGNKGHNEPPPFNNEMSPELRKLMEKRKAAMDAFKPRSTFLDPEKTLNVGSLRESFKKITEGDLLFKSRNQYSDDSGSLGGNRSSFGNRNSFGAPFVPRGSEFEPRGPPPFRSQGDFDSSPHKFESRGSPGNFGPRNLSPRGPNFGPPVDTSVPPPIEQDFRDNKKGPPVVEIIENVEENKTIEQAPPMESPKMPEMFQTDATQEATVDQDIMIISNKEADKSDDVVEIPKEPADNAPMDNSWMNSAKLNEPQVQSEKELTDKNENLPFMGEDDPKPTDLNMEPPPDFPNLGPVITTPMDPPPAFMEGNFPDEPPKDMDNREFEGPFSTRPPPFGMRGPGNFGPRGMNQPFGLNDQFGSRGMNSNLRSPFGPRGMDGPPLFGPRGGMFNSPFGPRGINQSFSPRGGMDGPPPFGPRVNTDGSPFGPRGMDGPFGPKGMDGPSPRFSMDNSPFGNRPPPFEMRDFQSDFNDSNKKIPSLFDLKFDPTFKKPDINPPDQDDLTENPIEDQPFNQDAPPRPFNVGNQPEKDDWNQPQKDCSQELDFTSDNLDEINQPSKQMEKNINPTIMESRLPNVPEQSQRDTSSNYDPFEIFKNREKERELRKSQMVEFQAQKQFNYNHGVNPNVQVRSIHDHIPVKVIDYEHNSRRVQELMTTIESFDYGHGRLNPKIPDPVYPVRRDFRNWEENEQNLREYSERMKSSEFVNYPGHRIRGRDYAREDQLRREEMSYRFNKGKRPRDPWDSDIEFKRMRHDRDPGDFQGHREDKNFKDRYSDKKSQDKNYADDDFLEEISWDGDNNRSLKDVNEETKNDENSNKDDGQNEADSSKKLDITKTSMHTMVEDLLYMPGRQNRPPKIVIILRGPPGSGKSFVAKLIKDKEVEQGGSAPRILSLDDYFLVEKEIETKDDNGKKISVKEMVYEFEEIMEPSYTASLIKAFKKNIIDGFFNFIILDSINEKITDYEELWSFAKSKGFKVYICEMDMDIQICLKRNIHKRSEDEINRIIDYFEPTPSHHQTLDVKSLMQDQEISEVQMLENEETKEEKKVIEEDQDSQDDSNNPAPVSKWEQMDAEDKLDRLDGLTKHKHEGKLQTMEDFLQVPDYYNMEDSSGKKRVRWADLEERKEQEKMRAVGFVVGHTNWDRMMDPTKGSSALTRTKYI